MSYIYLASPYFHLDSSVMQYRYYAACLAAGEIINTGRTVYSPIVHFHPIADACPKLPRDFDYWSPHNLNMLRGASEFLVLRLEGWEDSKGVAAEIRVALAMGLKMGYVDC